jgi:hypothetical protein
LYIVNDKHHFAGYDIYLIQGHHPEQTIRHSTPVLVMKGTGRVADLICDLSCVCRFNKSESELDGLHYFVSGPQRRDLEVMDPRILHRLVLAKRVVQDIQAGNVEDINSQTIELNRWWKDLFLEYLFKSQEELLKELQKGNQLCDVAKELKYVLENMGRLFTYDIKSVSRADGGGLEGGEEASLVDAVAKCVCVEMRRKGHGRMCLRLWWQLVKKKSEDTTDEADTGLQNAITRRINEISEMSERSFRKNELLLLIQVNSE